LLKSAQFHAKTHHCYENVAMALLAPPKLFGQLPAAVFVKGRQKLILKATVSSSGLSIVSSLQYQ
jgi:hypothetical protein